MRTRPSLKTFRGTLPAVLALGLIATLPFLPLVFWPDYLYDDIEFIALNPNLHAVKAFADVFHFQFQSSKPVTNFFLALAFWLGHGAPWAQRAMSLFFHAIVTGLIYANLKILIGRMKPKKIGARLPFWIAAFFGLTPLHSEALAMGQFRGELLGALFTLVGLLAVQIFADAKKSRIKFGLGLVYWLAAGLAILSKESYFFILPVSAAVFYGASGKRRDRIFFIGLGLTEIFWGIGLWLGLRSDPQSVYHYAGVAGSGVLSPAQHLEFSARALGEGITKWASGQGLTTIRLMNRYGPFAHGGSALYLIFFAATLGLVLWAIRAGGWLRLWTLVLLASIGFYLAVPNLNLGAEHYWYFACLPMWCLAVFLAHAFAVRRNLSGQTRWFVGVTYAFCLFAAAQSRVLDMRSHLNFTLAELDAHPEAIPAWLDVVGALLARGENPQRAWRYLDTAKKQNALRHDADAMVAQAEVAFYLRTGQSEAAVEALGRAEAAHLPPRRLARLYADLSQLEIADRDCESGDRLLRRAHTIDPENSNYGGRSRELTLLAEQHPQFCREPFRGAPN